MNKSLSLLSVCLLAAFPSVSSSTTIFADDFESGNLNNWTSSSATPSPLKISNAKSVVPAVGTYSALIDSTANRMHHNLGSEVSGASVFTYFMYDDGSVLSNRVYAEVRGYSGTGIPNGGTAADGDLEQLLAIGRYNSVTLTGDVFDATTYQARLTFGTNAGWFNLNGPGTPARSVGWHQFDIEKQADGTSLNFYVDSVLSRTLAGAVDSPWDTVLLGSALGTGTAEIYVDGVNVRSGAIPEPSSMGLGLLAGAAFLRRRRR